MGVIRLFVCARATLDRRIRLGEKTPVAREFVGNAQVEAKLRACAQASSHGLSLQYMNLGKLGTISLTVAVIMKDSEHIRMCTETSRARVGDRDFIVASR